jgi:chromosome segregation ATPase
MIEQILVFSLGCLAAGLVWLLCLPAFWRRASRLARRDIEQALPLTPNEIAAEQDRLRAERAIELGRLQREVEAARRQAVAAKSEVGERLLAERGFLDAIEDGRGRIADLQSRLHSADASIEELKAQLKAEEDRRDRAEQDITRLEAQRAATTRRLSEATDLAEQRRIRIDDLSREIEAKAEALAQETMRATNLRLELQTSEIHLRESRRELAELMTIAARHRANEGETSREHAVVPANRNAAPLPELAEPAADGSACSAVRSLSQVRKAAAS